MKKIASSFALSLSLLLSVEAQLVDEASIQTTSAQPVTYAQASAQLGAPAWSTRDYALSDIGEMLMGADQIRLPIDGDDEYNRDSDYLSFKLLEDAWVTVAFRHHSRGSKDNRPSWVDSSWEVVSSRLAVGVLGHESRYKLFAKQFSAGARVTLPGNYADSDYTGTETYLIFIKDSDEAPREQFIDQYHGLLDFHAKAHEGKVELAVTPVGDILQSARKLESLEIYRSEYDGSEFGYFPDFGRHHRPANWDDAVLIHKKAAPFEETMHFEFTDEAVEYGKIYVYWIKVSDNEYRWGPKVAKVRHPEVWIPQETIDEKLAAWAEKWPQFVSLTQVGSTVNGHPIQALSAGEQIKPLLLISMIHPGERGAEALMHTMEQLLNNNMELLQQVGVVMIPVLNVDARKRLLEGYPYMIRHNSRGVDLNRNFPAGWSDIRARKGPEPASEPETQAVMKAVELWPPEAIFSYHADQWRTDSVPPLPHQPPELLKNIKRYSKAYFDGYHYDRKMTMANVPYRLGIGMQHSRMPQYGVHDVGVPAFDVEDELPDSSWRPGDQDTLTPEEQHYRNDRTYHAILNVLLTIAEKRRFTHRIGTHRSHALADIGTPVYADRAYAISKMSDALKGGQILQTFVRDENSSDPELIRIAMRQNARVALCIPKGTDQIPQWITANEWVKTAEFVNVQVGEIQEEFDVYSRHFQSGDLLTLGGANRTNTGMGSYFAIILPEASNQ